MKPVTAPDRTLFKSISAPVPSSSQDFDWVSVILGLIALAAVLGLIPFWMWVYFVYNPPIR